MTEAEEDLNADPLQTGDGEAQPRTSVIRDTAGREGHRDRRLGKPRRAADTEVINESSLPPSHSLDLGPAYAVLQALVGDRIPAGTLGPSTVPPKVLAIPIRMAVEDLIAHNKRCKNSRCPHVPSLLRKYRSMRPDAIRSGVALVHKVLWTDPKHELVVSIRTTLLKQYADVARKIVSGELTTSAHVSATLAELGQDGPRILAAVLWACDFDGPSARAFFRCLVPLIDGAGASNSPKPHASDEGSLNRLKERLRESARELRKAKQTADHANSQLRPKERALENARRELQEANERNKTAEAELTKTRGLLEEANNDVAHTWHKFEGMSSVNGALRRDLNQLQKELREVDSGRSSYARQAALERRRVAQLKLKLESLPHGPDAVHEFLVTEEKRIQEDRLRLQGSPKLLADAAWTRHKTLETAFLDSYPAYRKQRPKKLVPKSTLKLLPLGGSSEIGRSCYLLQLGKHRILVDCGIKPNATEELHPDIDRIDRIDALIVTHAHGDHIGWIPALVHKFGKFEIYSSEATSALLPVMLEDSLHQYMRRMAVRRRIAMHSRSQAVEAECYDGEDVRTVHELVSSLKFSEQEFLHFGGISVRLFPAGHILGAASVLIEDTSGRRIFFSGDISSFPQLTVPAAEWPDDVGDVDLLVLESTYAGKAAHKPMDESRAELIRFIQNVTEDHGGSVILASFALGRAQELLSLLLSARGKGDIGDIPIYVDGMINRINPIYRDFGKLAIGPDDIVEVSGKTDRDEICATAHSQPSIILTTSGMMNGGPVIEYAQKLLPDPRHRIVLAGYQDEGAPSKALIELGGNNTGKRVVQLKDENGDDIRIEAARPAFQVQLSAHADQPGLITYSRRMRPAAIALVHGVSAGQEQLRSRLLEFHPRADITCGPLDVEVP